MYVCTYLLVVFEERSIMPRNPSFAADNYECPFCFHWNWILRNTELWYLSYLRLSQRNNHSGNIIWSYPLSIHSLKWYRHLLYFFVGGVLTNFLFIFLTTAFKTEPNMYMDLQVYHIYITFSLFHCIIGDTKYFLFI